MLTRHRRKGLDDGSSSNKPKVGDADYQQALEETIRRDRLDSQRADSPLTVPAGATVIDTAHMDFDETVATVVSKIRAATGVGAQPTPTRG